ncbi:MAG: AAA family ATPase [Candidatus Binatia bacterium]
MYNEYFGFIEAPFSVTPDPRFSYTNSFYQEAFATLRYGIESQKGFIVITGEAGTGKTTLLRRLMQSFGPHIQTAYVFNTHLSFNELLRLVLNDLGLRKRTDDRLQMIAQINEYLIKQLTKGNIVTLLVDEAQKLSLEMLEEIRLLSNLETDTEKLLQIVLMGQPELERKLDQPELRQLKQRVALRCRLDPLPGYEVGSYILSRLKAVGYEREDLFNPLAVDKIAAYSRGIPRLINTICDNGLLIAYAASKKNVSAAMIEEVARDLRLNERSNVENGVPAPAGEWSEDAIENLAGFRSRRADKNVKEVPPAATRSAAPDSAAFVIGMEEKFPQFRAEKRSVGLGIGVLALLVVLGLAGALFYSQRMWGGLVALSDNFKEFSGLRGNDSVPAEPSLPTEKLPPDPFEERSRSQEPRAEPAPIEPQQTDDIVRNPENSAAGRSRSSVQEEPNSSIIRKAPEVDRPAPPRQSPAPSRQEPVASDRTLEVEIHRAINLRAIRGVAVSVQDGTAYLKGRVASPRQRITATRAARSVPGVKAVENQILIY